MLLSHPSSFSLPSYLTRIGYDGPRAATLVVLRELHRLHPQAIAFENISPLVGWPVALDTESLQQKLVYSGRGGWCFEQNLLFAHALTALGFSVTGLAARVVYNVAEGTITPRSHMLLRIDLDGAIVLADVGFGGLTLTGPLALTPGVVQPTPHEPFRIVSDQDVFVLQALVRDQWVAFYRFTLEPSYLADYQVSSWYLSHNPASFFTTTLIAARPESDRRHTLRNNLLTTHFPDGRSEQRSLRPDDLRSTLETTFRLRLPDSPELTAALIRAAVPPAEPAR